MRVSSKTQYALLTVLDLALHRNTGVIKVPDISRRQGIPQKFLEQILLSLKGGGVVGSKRGAKGGYFLARPASDISLAAIVRLTEKAMLGTSAIKNQGDRKSPFADVWDDLDRSVTNSLESVSIQDICERVEESSKVLQYSI